MTNGIGSFSLRSKDPSFSFLFIFSPCGVRRFFNFTREKLLEKILIWWFVCWRRGHSKLKEGVFPWYVMSKFDYPSRVICTSKRFNQKVVGHLNGCSKKEEDIFISIHSYWKDWFFFSRDINVFRVFRILSKCDINGETLLVLFLIELFYKSNFLLGMGKCLRSNKSQNHRSYRKYL